MRRYDKYDSEMNQMGEENQDPRYNMAYKQVKKIKGFYTHLLIYILINAFLIIRGVIFKDNQEFWRWETFSTAILWGIGLVFHAFSVFGKNVFFSSKWEERKINELMEKEKDKKWE